ncbi:MAG: hypothetical protein M3Y03_07360 [Verrucomicrobiota bacterium]|nr:hypothetical protein [Verrucomicrobiota bacterium]
MKKSIALTFLAALLCTGLAQAQDAFKGSKEIRTVETGQPALDLVQFGSSYVFKSDLDNHGSFGDQGVLQNYFEYSHRFLLTGKFYFRAGVAYERFDFSSTSAPVPNHLQSVAGIIGIDYMIGNDVGAFLQIRPGFYTENTFDEDSFDFPITLGRAFVLQPDKLFIFVGVNAAFLRGEYPILPFAGIIYRPNEQWNIYGVLPEPKITYSFSKKLAVYAGGQLVGGSYRTDENNGVVPHKLSNAQVDYSEYRAGLGLEYHPCDQVSVLLGGGYAFLRRVNFDRAGQEYDADPALYVRASFRAEF